MTNVGEKVLLPFRRRVGEKIISQGNYAASLITQYMANLDEVRDYVIPIADRPLGMASSTSYLQAVDGETHETLRRCGVEFDRELDLARSLGYCTKWVVTEPGVSVPRQVRKLQTLVYPAHGEIAES